MNKHAPGAPVALVPVFAGEIAGSPVQLCNARHLHRYLMVGRDFSNWIKDRIEQYGFVAGEDFITIGSPNLANQKGRGGDRRSIEYHITLDMAKELAMVENNGQGRHIRRYFIACERKAHATPAQLPAPSDSLPPAVQEAIRRKVLELSVQSADAIRDSLETKARAWRAEYPDDQVLHLIEHAGVAGYGMALVPAALLRHLAATVRGVQSLADIGMETVHDVEDATGQLWYGRPPTGSINKPKRAAVSLAADLLEGLAERLRGL
jgi:phage anti-repressor protein